MTKAFTRKDIENDNHRCDGVMVVENSIVIFVLITK